jgi:hypothetical protein
MGRERRHLGAAAAHLGGGKEEAWARVSLGGLTSWAGCVPESSGHPE